MTKSDLVEKLSESLSSLTKKECEVIVDTVFLNMKDALHRGEKIEIRGFGSFTVRTRRAKEGRNPKTGEKVAIPRSGSPSSRSARNCGKWSTPEARPWIGSSPRGGWNISARQARAGGRRRAFSASPMATSKTRSGSLSDGTPSPWRS